MFWFTAARVHQTVSPRGKFLLHMENIAKKKKQGFCFLCIFSTFVYLGSMAVQRINLYFFCK